MLCSRWPCNDFDYSLGVGSLRKEPLSVFETEISPHCSGSPVSRAVVDGLLLEGGVVADLGPLGVGQGHNLPHGHCG